MEFCQWRNFLKIIFKGQVLWLLTLLILQIFAGVSPIIIAWLNSHLIDSISTSNLDHKSIIGIYPEIILALIVASALLIAFSDLFTVLQNFLSDYFHNLVYKRIQLQLLDVVSNYPTNHLFEDPEANNTITLAKESAKTVSEYVSVLSQVLVMIFGLVSAVMLGFAIVWWLPFLLLVTMTPFIYCRTKIENKTWNVTENYGYIFSKLSLYERVLTTPEFSKDIRLYNMQNKLLRKWEALYNEFFKAINDLRIKGVFKVGLWAFISGIGPLIAFWYVTVSAINGSISIGKLSFLLGIIIQLRGSITCLMYNSADIIRTVLMTKPILSLLDIEREQAQAQVQEPIPVQSLQAQQTPLLFFANVSFIYPGSHEYAIKDLSFTLKEGESVALVGENGSGKSTLLKLICRLYLPTSGNIYWKGQDISSFGFEDYRANIAVLFQDFAKFPTTVRENIEIDQCGIYSDNTIMKILEEVGLEFLQDKLDVSLFKGLANSMDLSGGEWQRLALARLLANMKNRQLLMFDEPTAALDPSTEHKILNLLHNQVIQNRTAIITSHRLALCQIVTNIIVLEQGSIIEQGNHKKLLSLKSKYYEMFQKQASWYKDL